MLTVYPDTNILLEPLDIEDLKVVIDKPFKVVILSGVIDELNKIVNEQKGRYKTSAKLALQMVKDLPVEESEGYVDDVLVKKSAPEVIVVTIDKDLKKRIKNKNGKIITKKQNQLFMP